MVWWFGQGEMMEARDKIYLLGRGACLPFA